MGQLTLTTHNRVLVLSGNNDATTYRTDTAVKKSGTHNGYPIRTS